MPKAHINPDAPLTSVQKRVLSNMAIDPGMRIYMHARRAAALHAKGLIMPWDGGWILSPEGFKWATDTKENPMIKHLLGLRHGNGVYLTNEEAVLALNALKRSSEGMPDGNETVQSHGRRLTREDKLRRSIKARML